MTYLDITTHQWFSLAEQILLPLIVFGRRLELTTFKEYDQVANVFSNTNNGRYGHLFAPKMAIVTALWTQR